MAFASRFKYTILRWIFLDESFVTKLYVVTYNLTNN